MNLDSSIKKGKQLRCVLCQLQGATIGCFKLRCTNVYHIGCAHKQNCMFFNDKVSTTASALAYMKRSSYA